MLTIMRACEQLQKFCEHEQASTRVIFASNSRKGQILRALLNWMGPFDNPNNAPNPPPLPPPPPSPTKETQCSCKLSGSSENRAFEMFRPTSGDEWGGGAGEDGRVIKRKVLVYFCDWVAMNIEHLHEEWQPSFWYWEALRVSGSNISGMQAM